MGKYRYEIEGCTGCGACLYECRHNAIIMVTGRGAVIDPEKCTGCGQCYDNCAHEAIKKKPGGK